MESKKYTYNWEDGKKILKGLGIAAGGAILAELSQVITQVDFGPYTTTVVALGSILINSGIKFLAGKK